MSAYTAVHFMCGTCFGERQRGMTDRGVDKVPEPLVLADPDAVGCCCICGQSDVGYTFYMKKNLLPQNWCGGVHEDNQKEST